MYKFGMYEFGQSPAAVQLSFYGNGTQNALYTGSYQNAAKVVIANATTASLVLPPPSSSGHIAGGYLTLNFGVILSTTALASVKTASSSWTVAVHAGMLKVTPTKSVSISTKNPASIALTGLVTDIASGSESLVMTLYGTSKGAIKQIGAAACSVTMLSAPLTPDTTSLDMSAGFQSSSIAVNTNASLRLFLVNNTGQAVTWSGPTPPTFQLSFTTGSSADALVSQSAAGAIAIAPSANGGASAWSISPPTTSHPAWRLVPGSSKKRLFETGSQATAAFDITNIEAKAVGIANAKLSCTGLTGYINSVVTLPIIKVPAPTPDPEISAFSCTPASVDLRTSDGQVTLSFTVQNATSVTIQGADYFQAGNVSGTTSGSVVVPMQETTTFILVATGAMGQVVTQSLIVDVSPNLYEVLPANTIMLWSGSQPPPGWVLCNGENDTPALADKFVVGAGGSYSPNDNGPADSHNHGVGSLSGATRSHSGHTHGFGSISFHVHGSLENNPLLGVSGHIHSVNSTDFTTGSADVTAGNPIGATTGGVRPSWYSLAYIVKRY